MNIIINFLVFSKNSKTTEISEHLVWPSHWLTENWEVHSFFGESHENWSLGPENNILKTAAKSGIWPSHIWAFGRKNELRYNSHPLSNMSVFF